MPTLEITGGEDLVVQVIDSSTDEIVYALRVNEASYRPKVLKRGHYTVRVGEGYTGKVLECIESLEPGELATVEIAFE